VAENCGFCAGGGGGFGNGATKIGAICQLFGGSKAGAGGALPAAAALRSQNEEKAMPELATIGYEGKTVDEFLSELEAGRIELVIDVRAVAASRRPGFSKTALRNALAERGIGYLHLRPLGTPAAGREAARKGRTGEMREIYAGQLETPEAELAFEQVLAEASERRAALLCYERDAPGCHRAMLAERMIARTPFAVTDL
jgi:uncharacterized protein (DUF488 family)